MASQNHPPKKAIASGSKDSLVFGRSYVINPTGAHKATIVWLHDVSRTGSDSEKTLRSLRMPNIKWICPTAPMRSITSLAGVRANAWFDTYIKCSECKKDDLDSLNYVTTYVTSLLSSEPPHVMKGVGGIGMGAAQALFYATAYAFGRVSIDLKLVIGIYGWLPDFRSLRTNMDKAPKSTIRASSLKIFLTDDPFEDDNAAATFARSFYANIDPLRTVGFKFSLKSCGGTVAINEIRTWLIALGL